MGGLNFPHRYHQHKHVSDTSHRKRCPLSEPWSFPVSLYYQSSGGGEVGYFWSCRERKMAGVGVTLEDLQMRLAEFARERDWDQFHSPRNLLLAMVGEVGELSEIFQWKGEVPRGLPNWKDEEKQHLGEELSDVLLYLVRLSDICGVDLGKAAMRKLKMNAIKYPVNAGSRGSSEKRTQINTGVDNDAGDDCVTGRSSYSDSSTSNSVV